MAAPCRRPWRGGCPSPRPRPAGCWACRTAHSRRAARWRRPGMPCARARPRVPHATGTRRKICDMPSHPDPSIAGRMNLSKVALGQRLSCSCSCGRHPGRLLIDLLLRRPWRLAYVARDQGGARGRAPAILNRPVPASPARAPACQRHQHADQRVLLPVDGDAALARQVNDDRVGDQATSSRLPAKVLTSARWWPPPRLQVR